MDGNGSSKGIAISPRDPSTFSEGTWTLQTYISAPNHLLRSLESLGWGFIHVHSLTPNGSPHSQVRDTTVSGGYFHLYMKQLHMAWYIQSVRGRSNMAVKVIYPRAPSTFAEGVWGGFRGSKYLLRRYLEP